MKGHAIISGKFLTVPILAVILLLTTACFTIVADPPPPQSNAGSTGAGSKVANNQSPGRDNDNAYELELIADPREAADFVVNPKANSRGAFIAGTAVTIDVLRKPGWEIQQWVGPVYAIAGDVAKLNMDQDQTVVVRMVRGDNVPAHTVTPRPAPTSTPRPGPTNSPHLIPAFTLAINGERINHSPLQLDHGKVEISPKPNGPRNLYLVGTRVRITAVPASGYDFAGWKGDCSVDGSVCVLVLNGNKQVGVSFERADRLYNLIVATVPNDAGKVQVSPKPIGPRNLYAAGTRVELEPDPERGFKFVRWEGACSGKNDQCRIVMTGNQQVIAVFSSNLKSYSLNLSAIPEVGGRIKVEPGPNSANGKYLAGTRLELKAVEAEGFDFRGWDGACFGVDDECRIVMNGNQQVVAGFTHEEAAYSLEVEVTPDDSGQVGATPGPNGGERLYRPGTRVTLVANPATGYEFAGWEGDCSGDSQVCLVVMNNHKEIEAHFAIKTYALGVEVDPVGGGEVLVTPGFDLIFSGLRARYPDITEPMIDRLEALLLEHRYPHGLEVRLEAVADQGYSFSEWGGDCATFNEKVCQLGMNGDKYAIAIFTEDTYTLTINDNLVSGSNLEFDYGSVDVAPQPEVESGHYSAGTQVTVTASPDQGFLVGEWGGDCAGVTGNVCTLTMDGDRSLGVTFLEVVASQ